MAVNKYVGDYRLIEELDERGRIRTRTEYIGKAYYHVMPARDVKRAMIEAGVAAVVMWALWIGAMVLPSTGMHSWFISLPFMAMAVPMFLLTETIFTVRPGRDPFERRHAERQNNRYPQTAVIIIAFAVFTLIAWFVSYLLGMEIVTGDGVFILCTLLIIATSAFIFAKRRCFALLSDETGDGESREV